MSILRTLRIVQPCPNCESAWTGGHFNPEDIDWCPICGQGPTGWVYTRWLFPWIQDWIYTQRVDAWQDGFERGKKNET